MRCALALLFVGFSKIGVLFYTPMRVFFYLIIFIYILLAVRRVYKESWAKTVSKSVVLFAGETVLFISIVVLGTYIAFSVA
jgi:membrane-anchored glycerophosphoryl diester phosphodiesterase (GDPDase)